MFKLSSATLAVFGLAAATFAQPTIERIAPENSVVVAGITSAGATLDRFKQTGLYKLWNSKSVQDMVSEPMEQMEEQLTQALHELGIEEEEGEAKGLPRPQGPIGLAIFPVVGGDGEEEHSPVGYMLMGDYGTAAPRMARIVDALLEKARKEGVDVHEEEVLGRTVFTFDLSSPEAEKAMGMEEGGDEDMDRMGDLEAMMPVPVPDPADVFRALGHVHYVHDGTRFLACSDSAALRKALETIDEDGHAGLEARTDFQASMRQLGPVDGYALLLMRDLWGGLIPGDDPTAMMIQGMIKSMVGDIRALGLGMRIGTGDAMMEDTFAVYMPSGKAGLTGLVDLETPQGTLPPFVGSQTVAYSRGNVKFNTITAFMRSVAQANPMLGAEINRTLSEEGPMLEKLFGALGPKVHSITTVSKPIRLDSLKELYAVECSKPADVEAVLSTHAAEWGLTARDFMGSRIYSFDPDNLPMMLGELMGAGGSTALGLGGGHLFIGPSSAVEDALRAGSRKGGTTLADDAEFKRAQRTLKAQKSVGWGVVNLPGYLEYIKEMPSLYMQEAMADDPEMGAQMGKQEDPWGGFDLKLIGRYVGPLCWEVRSTQDGFAGRYLVLPPSTPPPDEANAGATR